VADGLVLPESSVVYRDALKLLLKLKIGTSALECDHDSIWLDPTDSGLILIRDKDGSGLVRQMLTGTDNGALAVEACGSAAVTTKDNHLQAFVW